MVNVLVTGIGSNVAQGILLGLRQYPDAIRTVGTSIEDVCAGYFMVDEAYQVPRYDCRDYLDLFLEILRTEEIDYVFPGCDPELCVLAEHRSTMEEATGSRILISEPAFIRAAQDKYLTSGLLKSVGLDHPATWIANEKGAESVGLPVIAKPRGGSASKGVVLLENQKQLDEFTGRGVPPDYCFQEYLEGKEYTCTLLFDKHGAARDAIVMERSLDEAGTTVFARILRNEEIEAHLAELGKQVSGVIGPINTQLRLVEGRGPVIFEINPRFSGTTAFRARTAFNDPLRLLLNLEKDIPIERTTVRETCFLRYLDQLEVPPGKLATVKRKVCTGH